MPGLKSIIDVHSHAMLPIGKGVPAPASTLPDWSVDGALAFMDEHGIAACVLSVPDAANHATGQDARDIARRVNESLAGIVAQHPSRFGALATLPGRDPDRAVAEVAYALDTLKMDGVATSTSINDQYLGEPGFDPWFAEMNRRGVTLFVHPTVTNASVPLLLGLNPSVIEFMIDTTRMLTNMVVTGAKKRFPDIRIISTHGGGTIPFLATRIGTLEHTFGVGPGRLELSADEVREGFASFYYDLTAATTTAQLGALLELVPVSRLVMGLDYPLMPQQAAAPAIADVGSYKRFSEADLRSIAYCNAGRLFPALLARIGLSQGAVAGPEPEATEKDRRSRSYRIEASQRQNSIIGGDDDQGAGSQRPEGRAGRRSGLASLAAVKHQDAIPEGTLLDDPVEDHRTRVARDKRARMRARLLAAVVQVCSAPGHAVIDDVLKAADVSRGTFYNHFTSLDEALDVIGRELADEMTVGLMPVYDVLTEPLDRAAAGLQLFLRRGAVDPIWGRFVSSTDHLFEDATLIAVVSADLRRGRTCGAYHFASIEAAVDFVVGATLGGIRRFVRGGIALAQVFELAAMILRGLGADAARTRAAIRRTDAHLRANAPGILPWWRDMADASSGVCAPAMTTQQHHGGPDEPSC